MREKLRAFLVGVGSVLNPFPIISADLPSDEDALRGDWEAVGNDLRKACGEWPVHR